MNGKKGRELKEIRIVKAEDITKLRKMGPYAIPYEGYCSDDEEPIYFAIYDGNKPVAYSAIELYNGFFLSAAYVLPNYRGQGFQGKMIRARIKYALEQDPSAPIWTKTMPWNVISMKNLLKNGFIPFEAKWGSNYETMVYWRLENKKGPT